MQPNHHPDPRPATPLETDETTIAAAFEQQLAQASSTPALATELRHAPPTLYGRFATAYRDLLALSRARRRKLLRSMGMSLAAAALAFALALGGVPTANAAGITVTGSCTLVDAITAANTDTATGGCAAGSGADTITLSGNVTLTSVNNTTNGANGLPLITSPIAIASNGATIARDAGAPSFRILQVAAGGNLTLNDTTITGGSSTSVNSGGSVYNASGGTLTISDSTISGNTGIQGGGIFSRGTLTISDSTISGNSGNVNTYEGIGGGLFIRGGVVTISNTTISGNSSSHRGGGLFMLGGTATLNNSTISGNTTSFIGGGLYIGIYSTLTLSNSTVSGNDVSGGFFGAGGGIYNTGTATLEHSLISGNTASTSGPEIQNYTGYYGNGATLNAANFNVIGHDSNAGSSGFTPSGSDIVPSQALAGILGALANNGGATLTQALVTGSPAIDAAPSGPATDQRGVARPQGPAFDIGAFELELSAASQIDQLIGDVQALIGSGTINSGQGNALITKLGNAQNYVTSDQTSQAISKLHTFINQVNSFISTGVLTSAEGQPLIDAANAAIHSLGG